MTSSQSPSMSPSLSPSLSPFVSIGLKNGTRQCSATSGIAVIVQGLVFTQVQNGTCKPERASALTQEVSTLLEGLAQDHAAKKAAKRDGTVAEDQRKQASLLSSDMSPDVLSVFTLLYEIAQDDPKDTRITMYANVRLSTESVVTVTFKPHPKPKPSKKRERESSPTVKAIYGWGGLNKRNIRALQTLPNDGWTEVQKVMESYSETWENEDALKKSKAPSGC